MKEGVLFLPMFLALLGALSPLLTAERLYQMKEWRLDRLREHVRYEGWFGQLFGWIRPAIILLFLGGYAAATDWESVLRMSLFVLAAMTVGQILLRRQRYPVWTAKARMIFLFSLAITALLAWRLNIDAPEALLSLPLLAWPVLLVTTLLLWPLDRILKARVMDRAAVLRRQYPDITVIGITGSVGKTTTKELLAHILLSAGAVATPEYVNSEMGVAQWLTKVLRQPETRNQKPETNILIVEMGAYRIGEIRTLCTIALPTIGVLTAVGSAHRGLFGSDDAIRRAKAELLESLPGTGHAFVNVDSPGVRAVLHRAICPVVTVGTFSDADVHAEDVSETPKGLRFRIGDELFFTGLRGTHNVTNVLLAIAVARHLGMPDEEIHERLASFQPLSHTFSAREERGVTLLDDTHNASPESLRAALAWAAEQQERPRVLLTGGLLEVGSEEDRILRELGSVAKQSVERVIFVTERGRAAFAAGYGREIERFCVETSPVSPSSLLLCIGRMPLTSIQRLLPRTTDSGQRTNGSVSEVRSPKS